MKDERILRAEALYHKGNDFRRKGNYQEAMNCYLEAETLDPDSPASTAREMLCTQYDFYYKDLYNP